MIDAMSTPQPAVKKPWYKKIWIWAIVGAVLVLGGVGQALGLGTEEEPVADATTAGTPAPETEAEEAPEEPEEGPASDEDKEAANQARAEQLEADLKMTLGVEEDFTELYAADPTLWGGYIAAVNVDGKDAYITLQVAEDDPQRDQLGERAAKALSTLLTEEQVQDINWIIVEDASHYVIAQEQPNPML